MKKRWHVLAASVAILWLDTPVTAQADPPRPFDLGVTSVEVTQKGSSSMFRRIRVRCDIANHGPGRAPSNVRILLTRPSGKGRKTVRAVVTKYVVPAGGKFFIAGEDTVWHATLPSYRCAIDYGTPGRLRVTGDNNASNDVGQSTPTK